MEEIKTPTSIDEIYGKFLPKITCYEYLKPNYTKEVLDEVLKGYLESVLDKYVIDLKLKVDFENRVFSRELEKLEKTILVYGLIVEWITPYKNNSQWLKQNLKSSEYNTISEANQLREIMYLHKEAEEKFEYWQTRYSHIQLYSED